MAYYLKDPRDEPYDSPYSKFVDSIVSDSSASGANSASGVPSDDNNYLNQVKDYFNGLLTNQGMENEVNRLYNSAEAALNRDFQSKESAIQRDWFESMSNSAYQRAMADMEAAGLNPILAYKQGGAVSSGTGISAGSAASYNTSGGDTLSSLLSAAADLIDSVAYSSASKFNKAFKIFKALGG